MFCVLHKAAGKNKDHPTPMNLNDGMNTPINADLATQQDRVIGISSSCDGNETGKLEAGSSDELNGSQIQFEDVNYEVKADIPTYCLDKFEVVPKSPLLV